MLIGVDFILDVTSVNDAIMNGTYDVVRVYKSTSYSGSYTLLDTVELIYGKTEYVCIDLSGELVNWYRISYYNSITTDEGSLSSPIQGVEIDFGYDGVSYPVETSLVSSERTVISRVRDILGDRPVVKRDFYDGSQYNASIGTTTGDNDAWSRVSSNNYVYELEDRGWPLSITVDGSQYTTIDNPIIQDYRYVVFSGSQPPLSVTGTLDIYYMQFRFSDKEIIDAYDVIDYIPGTAKIDSADIPTSWYYLYTGIKLLEKDFQKDAVQSASIQDGDTRYDNTRAMAVRQEELVAKRKQLEDEIEEFLGDLMHSLTPVRVD